MAKRVKCVRCDGKGRIDMHVCGCCDGDGWYYEEATESVGQQFLRTTGGSSTEKKSVSFEDDDVELPKLGPDEYMDDNGNIVKTYRGRPS